MSEPKCENLEALLKAEVPALNAAFGHRRYLISKRMSKEPKEIDWEEAKQEFMDRYLGAWAEGFKYVYCNYVCTVRDKCQVKDDELNQWSKYVEDEKYR